LDPEHGCWLRVANPRIIDAKDGIAHTSDEVYEIVIPMNFGQPHRIANFTLEPILLQAIEGSRPIL
jgi:hypothetical protein